jgi:hypothetical protein
LPNPCLNGGACEDSVNGYSCHCQPNFSGYHCETRIDIAGSNQLKGDGGGDGGVNVVAGAMGGALVITVIVIVTLVFVIRRRRRLQPTYDVPRTHTRVEDYANPAYGLPSRNINEEVIYSEIKDIFSGLGKTTSSSSGVYAQPDAVYADIK